MKMIRVLLLTCVLLLSQNIFSQLQWKKLEAGSFSSLALRTDGTIWSWGFNANGQLGIGNTTQQESPMQIGTEKDWADIAVGAFHCLALKKDGSLWAWGLNGNGQLGDGSTASMRLSPIRIGLDTDWKSITAGQAHSIALKSDGSLWTWGLNSSLQLGTGDNMDRNSPVKIGSDTDWISISAGGGHSHAIKSNGELWAWGNNGNGQLGNGNNTNTSNPVKVGSDTDWKVIDGGFLFTVAIKQDLSLWTWGDNNVGQLGNGGGANQNNPVNIGTGSQWSSISAGSAFSFAIRSDGALFAWGLNQFGQLGNGNSSTQFSPIIIGSETNWSHVVTAEGSINAGVDGFHSLGFKSDKKVICGTGNNESGQLGNDNTQNLDEFGCETGEIPVGIHGQKPVHKTFSIYPNPTKGNCTISLPSNNEMISIFQLTAQGQLIEKSTKINGESINLELKGNPGMYLIKIQIGDEVVDLQRIIKL